MEIHQNLASIAGTCCQMRRNANRGYPLETLLSLLHCHLAQVLMGLQQNKYTQVFHNCVCLPICFTRVMIHLQNYGNYTNLTVFQFCRDLGYFDSKWAQAIVAVVCVKYYDNNNNNMMLMVA
eukprot:TRINITY_DN855_c0_g1_i1.p3 TRINITY_DN855_c0_g1~~TRINITY_DN855_c0_g1_i1.p3  ORF type:complete len:122 (+),score=0.13 TRINITY_DN855_c0_g1_i1:12-377(+)